MRRLKSDLFPILRAAAEGRLADIDPPEWDPRPCVGVVAAAEGYPTAPRKGDLIRGLDEADEVEGVVTFHAGTRADAADVFTNGGRVLCITALGSEGNATEGMEAARARAYEAYDRIDWDGKFCRRDIGKRAPRPAAEPGDRRRGGARRRPADRAGVGARGRRPRGPGRRPSRTRRARRGLLAGRGTGADVRRPGCTRLRERPRMVFPPVAPSSAAWLRGPSFPPRPPGTDA